MPPHVLVHLVAAEVNVELGPVCLITNVTPCPPLPPRGGGERAERDRAPHQREISQQERGTKCPGPSQRGPAGGTREAGERGSEARRVSPQPVTPAKHTQPQQQNINATGRKGNTHSLSTNAVKGLNKPTITTQEVKRENKARLRGHNSAAGKTPKWETKDYATRTGCPLG